MIEFWNAARILQWNTEFWNAIRILRTGWNSATQPVYIQSRVCSTSIICSKILPCF